MALDARYMLAPALQQLFRDKLNGDPLSNGKVFFYRDTARTIIKPVYQITGSPPNYTYIQIPTNPDNSVSLNSIGAFEQAVYYFPFDENGDIDLYFIQVYDENDVFQFSREGYPNFTTEGGGTAESETNYISNGKFLAHQNIMPDGTITEDETIIAYGGWSFNRNVVGISNDKILFSRFGSFDTNPPDNPRYSVNVISETSSTGSYKELRIKFKNVNRFSSDVDKYTFGFYGESNGGDIATTLTIVKNYGTGGSSEDRIPISGSTQTISSGFTKYTQSFSFGENSGKTIGTEDDDFVQLCLTFPPDQLYNLELTDFFLIEGDKVSENFPITTDRMDTMTALGGGIALPDYDGNNLSDFIILTKEGFAYSNSQIGSVIYSVCDTPDYGYLSMDGTKYPTNGISADGIPYKRLQSKLFSSTRSLPKFGTGADYLEAFVMADDHLGIMNTTRGSVSATVDFNTGFTFENVTPGVNFSFGTDTYMDSGLIANTMGVVIGKNIGAVPPWTLSVFEIINNAQTFSVHEISFLGGGIIPPGFVTTSYAKDATATDIQFDFWYQVDGLPLLPPPALTNAVRISVNSTDTSNIIGQKTMIAYQNKTLTDVTTSAAAALSGGEYFQVFAREGASDQAYHVWYIKDGVGADPSPANSIGISVEIAGTDTALEVANKTTLAINGQFFAVPDVRGMFIRVWDNGAGNDPSANFRFNPLMPFQFGDEIGNYQRDEVINHRHGNGGGGNETYEPGPKDAMFHPGIPTDFDGGIETRPKNISVNCFIKY